MWSCTITHALQMYFMLDLHNQIKRFFSKLVNHFSSEGKMANPLGMLMATNNNKSKFYLQLHDTY